MSDFSGYSKSKHNIFDLNDKQIKEYYFKAERDICKCGYLEHIPITTEDALNPFFLRDSIVKTVSNYLFQQKCQQKKKFPENIKLVKEYNVLKKEYNDLEKKLRKIEDLIIQNLTNDIKDDFVNGVVYN